MVHSAGGIIRRSGPGVVFSVSIFLLACVTGCYHPPGDSEEQATPVPEALPSVKPPGSSPPISLPPSAPPVSAAPVADAGPAPEISAPAPAPPPEAAPAPTETAPPEPPAPAPPETAVESVPPAGAPALSLANINRLREGMSYEEVLQLIGMPGVTVATNGIDSVVHKWTSDGGSFLGKFQGGKLLRKTVQSRPKTEEESDTSHVLTQEQYNDVKEGMTLEEVLDRLDVQARLVTDDSQQDVTIYKWTDDHGSSFTARFENGKLVRKTGFYVGPLEKPSPLEVSESEGEESAESMAETPETLAQEEEAEEGEEGPTETAAWDTGSPAVIAEEPSAPESSIREEVFEPIAEPVPRTTTARTTSRVRVTGATRRAREQEAAAAAGKTSPVSGRSYKPKAKLPDYTYSFRRGSYEVRLRNSADVSVKAGLRAGNRGKDVRIPARGEASIYVDRGTYELYYVFADSPYTLHHGGGIRIADAFQTNIRVTLVNEASLSRDVAGY